MGLCQLPLMNSAHATLVDHMGKSDFPIVYKVFLVLYTDTDAGGRNSCEVNLCFEIFDFL